MKMKQADEMIKDNLIVKHLSGSHAYGMATPESDVDNRGIFYSEKINIITPFFPIRECVDVTEEDTKFYELTHYVKLYIDCNPNIVESLWIDPSHIIFKDDIGIYDKLVGYRSEMLSTKLAFTYTGYAHAQLKRIKGHNKWINNPMPKDPPKQSDYVKLIQNFTPDKILNFDIYKWNENHRLIPYGNDIFGIYESKNSNLYDYEFTLNTIYDESSNFKEDKIPKFIVKYNKLEYKADLEKWKLYWKWKKNRNEKRSLLEEKYGYDTKHASHLIRLLRTGYEALSTGEIIVKRPDAQELLEIRNGAMTYEELLKYSDMMKEKINKLYDKSILPKKVDRVKIANILMELQEMCWNN